MFFRRPPHRQTQSFLSRSRSYFGGSNVDRVMDAKRGYRRRLFVEPLEQRQMLAVITVNSALDGAPAADGALTLREAILAANTNTAVGDAPAGDAGLDEIRFAIPGAGPHVIAIDPLQGALVISEAAVIDGFTESLDGASSANTNAITASINADMRIVIDGSGVADDGVRITTSGSGTTIRGLVINGFGGSGIEINNSNNNIIAGNFIGTDVTGEVDEGNGEAGVHIGGIGNNNRIGGTAAADRNLISGNVDGIFIEDGTGNIVLGNFIGTDRDGLQDLGNSQDGVGLFFADGNTIGGTLTAARNVISGNGRFGVGLLDDADDNLVQGNYIGLGRDGSTSIGNAVGVNIATGINPTGSSSGNTIGGTPAGSRNVISGNIGDGVQIEGIGTSGNMLLGNFIGTTAAGTAAAANGGDGVQISAGATGNRVGDVTDGARNVISGNDEDGIEISDSDTSGNIVQGNFIGTAANGTTALANGDDGIEIENGASNNTIGGSDLGAGNTIAFNDGNGVAVGVEGGTGNLIRRNSIFSNAGLGIDLGPDGVTPNDFGATADDDEGPNRLQNFPVFSGDATLLGNSIALAYRVPTDVSNAMYPLTVDFYIADSAGPDAAEGRTFLGSDTYDATDAQNEKAIILPVPTLLTSQHIVATATDAAGNTSEFSARLAIGRPVILGSEPTIIRNDETIVGDDINFYQYIAHSTGKLVVRIDFQHVFGDLDLEVRDQFGNLLAASSTSSPDQNFEEVLLPVVSQEPYFIHVSGNDLDPEFATLYDLEVENFPAPVPTGVHLDPASDTGALNNDGVTGDTTPTFFIQTDVLNFVDTNGDQLYQDPDTFAPGFEDAIDALSPAEANRIQTDTPNPEDRDGGIAVELTLVNTTTGTVVTGFAEAVVGVLPEVYRFTPSAPLTAGVYLVSARTKIFDGQGDAEGGPDQQMGRSNASPPLWITIAADQVGPQITDVDITGFPDFNLFEVKPTDGPTPLVTSLTISVTDPPGRIDPDFLAEALNATIADVIGNYRLVGDYVGVVTITDVVVTNLPPVGGQPARATIELRFAAPLPDDRYTLTVLDNIVDLAGNILDGESNASAPGVGLPLPSGDGVPGGDFIARFTIDSRPEIGSYVAQDIDIDINGNFVWDPANAQIGNDAVNVDLSFTLPVANADGSIGLGGYNVHDLLFAGKFLPLNGNNGENGNEVAVGAGDLNGVFDFSFFDQLAAFGNSAELGAFRWIIDTNSDGVVTLGTDILTIQPTLGNFFVPGAIPVAGNFDNNAANGDEIGLYFSGQWALDTNRNFVIDDGDTFITNDLFGHPIVGDFDGDGLDDLAVFNNNVFSFNLANDGLTDANDASLVWGFPGVLDRPVAADMDQDGIDDIGLWVPRTSASLPRPIAEWYFLLSNDFSALGVPAIHTPGSIARLNHAFTPRPFGNDLFAEFGDERSLPIVGNFDPPVARAAPGGGADLPGDYNRDGRVDEADRTVWAAGFGSTSNMAADGNRDGRVDAADFVMWRKNNGRTGGSGATVPTLAGGSVETTTAAVLTQGATPIAEPKLHPPLSTATDDVAASRLIAVDGVFAEFSTNRPARAAFRPSQTAALESARGDLLLAAWSRGLDRLAIDDAPHPDAETPGSHEPVDSLLAEFTPVGEIFGDF